MFYDDLVFFLFSFGFYFGGEWFVGIGEFECVLVVECWDKVYGGIFYGSIVVVEYDDCYWNCSEIDWEIEVIL